MGLGPMHLLVTYLHLRRLIYEINVHLYVHPLHALKLTKTVQVHIAILHRNCAYSQVLKLRDATTACSFCNWRQRKPAVICI